MPEKLVDIHLDLSRYGGIRSDWWLSGGNVLWANLTNEQGPCAYRTWECRITVFLNAARQLRGWSDDMVRIVERPDRAAPEESAREGGEWLTQYSEECGSLSQAEQLRDELAKGPGFQGSRVLRKDSKYIVVALFKDAGSAVDSKLTNAHRRMWQVDGTRGLFGLAPRVRS